MSRMWDWFQKVLGIVLFLLLYNHVHVLHLFRRKIRIFSAETTDELVFYCSAERNVWDVSKSDVVCAQFDQNIQVLVSLKNKKRVATDKHQTLCFL